MSSYLTEFQNRIAQHDLPAIMRLWEEYCSGEEVDPEELKQILITFKQSDISESMGRHVDKILPLWQLLEGSSSSEEILKLIVDLETSNQESLRELAFDYLKKKYGNKKDFNEKFRLVGLRTKENFQGCISHFELLNHMEVGNFVFHSGGWGVGEIMDVSLLREQLCLEFDYVAGRKDLSFSNAFNTLIPIPKEHFLALRFGDPDRLEEMARKDPLETVRLLLKDLGPKTAAEIKDELCDLIIPAQEWTRWWQNARAKIKKDTLIQTPDDLQKPFRALITEISHEERLKKALEVNKDADSLIQIIYSFKKDFGETLKKQEFKTFLKTKLSEILTYSNLSFEQELQVHFFLHDLGEESSYATITQMIKNADSIQEVIRKIDILSFKKRVMLETRKSREDWQEIFLALLFTIDHGPLKDYLLHELLSVETATKELKERLKNLYSHPSQNPETFLWYFQKAMQNDSLPYADNSGKNLLFESLLILLNHLEYAGAYKESVKKIHALITKERYLIVRQIMQNATIDEVSEFLLLATKCQSFTDHDIKILHSLAEVAHPLLGKKRKQLETSTDDAHVIWVTQEGYQNLQTKIHKIATVDRADNAKEIETARAHGDLRENMEFKAAKERQSRIQTELKFLSDQLSRARVITKEDVSTDEVGVGSIVECKNEKEVHISYTILGPLEADPEKNILSFQSKLAQTIKGLTVGKKFQFQNEEYTITGIYNYFDAR